jgi:hypothetical protein
LASAAQAVGAIGLPALEPEMHALARDTEPAGDLGLTDADGEQLRGAQPTRLKLFAFVLCRGAAGNGWHAADPDRQGSPASTSPCQADTQGPLSVSGSVAGDHAALRRRRAGRHATSPRSAGSDQTTTSGQSARRRRSAV